MKNKRFLAPKGVDSTEAFDISLRNTGVDFPSAVYAKPLRKRAKTVLDGALSGNRLTLVLGIMVTIGLGFAVPMMLDCLLVIADVLSALSDKGEVLWPVVTYAVVAIVVFALFTLPLLVSLFRMAALMMEAHTNAEWGRPQKRIGLGELLYPFTSLHAYGRTLLVALRSVAGVVLVLVPPAALIVAAAWWVPLVSSGLPGVVHVLLWIFNISAACVALAFLAVWRARAAGFGYLVFCRPDVSVKELYQTFKSCRRTAALPLWLLLSFVGWSLVSLLAVFIPFLVHTLPYMLLSAASYGRFLSDTRPSETGETIPVSESDPLSVVTDPTEVKYVAATADVEASYHE